VNEVAERRLMLENHNDTLNRWLLPDKLSALQWCRERNAKGVKGVLDIEGSYSRDASQAMRATRTYISAAAMIAEKGLKASLAVKLSTIGVAFDRRLCRRNLRSICEEGVRREVGIEMDMEGKSLVDFYIQSAMGSAAEGCPVTLALQAYLDRTPEDLDRVLDNGIRVRLVKGAYLGDTEDFKEIQRRLKSLALRLSAAGVPFSIGTHDPEVVNWARTDLADEKSSLEFGFLKGMSDETKMGLVSHGWAVAEYVPFGRQGDAYISRRLRYLRMLARIGRSPAP
jgi:proline dehydrogenase